MNETSLLKTGTATPNLKEYETFCPSFTWENEMKYLEGLPAGKGLNIAHEAVDRHAGGDLKDTIALRFIHKDRSFLDITYPELKKLSARFAGVLTRLGTIKGERVFVLAGRIPELYITALG